MSEVSNKSILHQTGSIVKSILLHQGDVSVDITQIFDSFFIEEDIERGFLIGCLNLLDDITQSRDSFSGTETIEVEFTSMDGNYDEILESYSKRFRIASFMHVIQPITGAFRALSLNLVSEAAIKNDSIKLMRTFSNTSSSSLVDHCCQLMGIPQEERFIEETLHAKNFTAPNVSPMDMINWAKKTSQSKSNNGSDFYFFENKDGVHFRSLESMKKEPPKHTLVFMGNTTHYTYNNILQMRKKKGFDIQDDIRHGGAGATVYTHDLYRKQYVSHGIDVSTVTKLNPVEQRGAEYEHNPMSHVQFWPHNQAYEFMDLNSGVHSALYRTVAKTRINFKGMDLEIPGNVDIKAGDIVNISIPGIDGGLQVSESGMWLVKKIRHTITQAAYLMQLEVVTDGNIENVQE